MKKTQVALAALALVASTAALADVKVAGCVDAAIVSTTAGTVLGGAGDGCASQFGLYGSEDIGGGLAASFNLETGFSTANGAIANGGNTATGLFNRKANVGVGTKEATVTLGLAKSAWIEAAGGGLTAYGMNGVGVPALAILNPGLSGTTQAGGFFVGNLAGLSGDLGMFNYNVQTTVNSASATADSFTAARLSTNFAGASLNFGYEARKNTSGGLALDVDQSNVVISGSYGVTSQLSINGAYAKQSVGSGNATTATNQAGYVLGAGYKMTDSFGVGITYARNDQAAAQKMTALSAQYDLSKRTALYANYADFNNATALNNGGTAEAANSVYNGSVISVGVNHSF